MTTFFLKAHQISEFEALIELDFFLQGLGSFFFFFLNFFKNYAFVLLHFPEIPTWVKKNIQFACTCKKRFLHLQKLNIKHHVYTFK